MANEKFIDCGKVALKGTTNQNFSHLTGKTGDLIIWSDGMFYFCFTNEEKQHQALTSRVVNRLGDLRNQASNEICIKTQNSLYTFARA